MAKLDIKEIIAVLESQGLVDQAAALKARLNPTLISNIETARKLARSGKLTIARESVDEVVQWVLDNHPNPESILHWFRRRVSND
jgi:hypothetical protein